MPTQEHVETVHLLPAAPRLILRKQRWLKSIRHDLFGTTSKDDRCDLVKRLISLLAVAMFSVLCIMFTRDGKDSRRR